MVGSIAATVVLIAAGPIASGLGAPEITPYLRVYVIDIFLQNVVRGYRDVMTGTGHFSAVARVSAIRLIARMVLIAVLVSVTGSVMAAVLANLCATVVSLFASHAAQKIPLRGRGGIGADEIWTIAAPLALYSGAMQLFSMIDLFALSALGWSAEDVGHYSAAANLSVPPSLFSLALAPLLLATLVRAARAGAMQQAAESGRRAIRTALWLLPIAALVAGSSGEIVRAIFGVRFAASGPLLALLFAAAVALTINAVSVAVLIAANRHGIVSALGVGSLLVALVGHLIVIPRMGPQGAASVTLVIAVLGAIVAIWLVHRTWRINVNPTLLRAAIIGAPVYWVADALATQNIFLLVIKIGVLSMLITAALMAFGEIDKGDVRRFVSAIAIRRNLTARDESR